MGKLHIKTRFGITPTDILNSLDLSFKAKGIYWYIQSKPDGWDFSAKRIAAQSKDGIDGVSSWLQELEEVKLLHREKTHNPDNWQWGIEYTLFVEPTEPEPTIVENPVTDDITIGENPVTDNPWTDNPPINSNKQSSKKDNSKQENTPPPFINKTDKILGIFDLAQDPEIYDLYVKFWEIRKGNRHPFNKASEVLFFGKLRDIDPRLNKQRKKIAIYMITKALEMSWRTIFALKDREVEEILKWETREINKANELADSKEKAEKSKKMQDAKKPISDYWELLSPEGKRELMDEATIRAKAERPDLDESSLQLKPLINIAKRMIIKNRIDNG